VSFTGLVALDELLGRQQASETGSATVGDTIADRAHDPVELFEVDEMKHLLADAINRMPDRERLVLTLYYYEGFTLAEIGALLGVTESRVCQIHTKAILQLRSRLAEPA
jgi:RNA polymerase sigma factor FliA